MSTLVTTSLGVALFSLAGLTAAPHWATTIAANTLEAFCQVQADCDPSECPASCDPAACPLPCATAETEIAAGPMPAAVAKPAAVNTASEASCAPTACSTSAKTSVCPKLEASIGAIAMAPAGDNEKD